MAAPESNGEEEPKSRTNPVFFDVLLKVIVVPTFTQKGVLDLASAMLGVAEAEVPPPLRLMSTSHGVVGEPQVFAAVQILAGFAAEQESFFTFFLSSPTT
jgi:hypothetical protein